MLLRRPTKWGIFAGIAIAISLYAVVPSGYEQTETFPLPQPTPSWPLDSEPTHAIWLRDQALGRADVWRPTDPSQFDFSKNPSDPSGLLSEPIVRCQFVPRAPHGTTTKFDCVLRDGEMVKVKYGHVREIYAEAAGSRVLSALGFGADRMYLVPKVRCYGCPRLPFYVMWALQFPRARSAMSSILPASSFTDFDGVAVERRFPGIEVEAGGVEGWRWDELETIDPSSGANRAERDALRLLAIFLAHWDNKAPNQRLMCTHIDREHENNCDESFAYIQDLGATFGPYKIDLEGWKEAPIWSDPAKCTVSMKSFPYSGGTFPDGHISEEGRQLLTKQLAALTEDQIDALFRSLHMQSSFYAREPDAREWAKVFMARVQTIAHAGPCPST